MRPHLPWRQLNQNSRRYANAPTATQISCQVANGTVQYLEKRLFVQLNGSRKVIGVLRGYDVCNTSYSSQQLGCLTVVTGLLKYCARRGSRGEGGRRKSQAWHGCKSPKRPNHRENMRTQFNAEHRSSVVTRSSCLKL